MNQKYSKGKFKATKENLDKMVKASELMLEKMKLGYIPKFK